MTKVPYDIILTCNYSPWSPYKGGGQKSTHMIATEHALAGRRVAVVYSKGLFDRTELPKDLPYDVYWAFFWALKAKMASPFRFLNPLSFYWTLKKICGPNTVLHSNGEEAALFGKLLKRRWVHTNRFPEFPKHILGMNLKKEKNGALFFRDPKYYNVHRCLHGADAVTVTSTHNQEVVKEIFGVSSQVVPNGIDSLFMSKLWQKQNQKGILYFGRMVKAKGVDTLLKAYSRLSEEFRRNHPLTLIGEGKEAETFQQSALELGISSECTWIPWANSAELLEMILGRALVVLPSREESFGNTMLESLATGIPLVTTDCGSLPEVLQDFATMVPVDSVEELMKAMQKHLSGGGGSQEKYQSVDRQNYVKENFSWAQSTQKFANIYGVK